MPWLRRNWPILVLLLVPLLAIGKAVFSGNGIGDFNQIAAMAPFGKPQPEQAWDVLQADSVLQFYVWRDLVFEAWSTFQFPLWNTYSLAGTPLLGNSQSAAIYPPHILVGVLRFPTETGIDLLAWFHLFLAGWGVHNLVRRFGGNEIGGVFAGAAFQLSPFMLSWTALPSVISTVAWIPWVMIGVTKFFPAITNSSVSDIYSDSVEEKGEGRVGVSRNYSFGHALLATALPAAMMIMAGHLQFVAYGFMGAGLLMLLLAAMPDKSLTPKLRISGIGKVAFAFLLGALIAGPHLFTTLSYSQFSHRRNTPTEEGYKAYLGLALPPAEVLSRLVSPFSEGNPLKKGEQFPTDFTPAIERPGANYAESATTVGPLVLIGWLLALVNPRSRRAALLATAIAFIAFLFTIGTGLNKLLYFNVPGWSSTGSPGRIQVLMILGLCVAAGLGFSKLPIPNFKPEQQRLTNLAIVVLAVILPVVYGTTALVRTGDPNGIVGAFDSGVGDNYERVAVINEPWSFVGIPPAVFPPNTLAANRVREIGGYDSLLHRDTIALTNEINGQDSFPPANGNMVFIKPTADQQKLAEAGVSMVIVREGETVRTIALQGPGRAYTPHGPAQILDDGFMRMKLKAVGPGRLIVKDRMMPGWSAWVNGKRVPMNDGLWREVELFRDGEQTVEFKYSPPGFGQGFLASIVGLVTCGLLFALTGRQRSSKANSA